MGYFIFHMPAASPSCEQSMLKCCLFYSINSIYSNGGPCKSGPGPAQDHLAPGGNCQNPFSELCRFGEWNNAHPLLIITVGAAPPHDLTHTN